jgi:hypothetical protein
MRCNCQRGASLNTFLNWSGLTPVDLSPYPMRNASAAEPRRKATTRASVKLIAPMGNASVNRTPATVIFLRH